MLVPLNARVVALGQLPGYIATTVKRLTTFRILKKMQLDVGNEPYLSKQLLLVSNIIHLSLTGSTVHQPIGKTGCISIWKPKILLVDQKNIPKSVVRIFSRCVLTALYCGEVSNSWHLYLLRYELNCLVKILV